MTKFLATILLAVGITGCTTAQIAQVDLPQDAGSVRVIAGEFKGAQGAARTFSPMNVWDLRLKANKSVSFTLPPGHTTALFVLHGAIQVGGEIVREAELAVMEREGELLVFKTEQDTTLLLLGGEPLHEPIVGYGPFVMNSEAEIRQAMNDYRAGRMGHIAA